MNTPPSHNNDAVVVTRLHTERMDIVMEYELVHEIKNHCPNNQMRDIFIEEVETDDPVAFVRARLKGRVDELTVSRRSDGVTIYAVCDGLRHEFSFNL